MIIKHPMLSTHLKKKISSQEPLGLYILIGQDPFLLNEAARNIKLAWRELNAAHECEETIFQMNAPSDWGLLEQQAYSYSLFSNAQLIEVYYEKKKLEAAGVAFLTHYLNNPPPHCSLFLRAPLLTAKQPISNHTHVNVVQVNSLNRVEMCHWITEQLNKRQISFHPNIPTLIHQYTQGNMLACSQVIEKIDLIYDRKNELTVDLVQEQLIDQCDFQLFELTQACLSQNPHKVIQLVHHAHHSHTEPTLVLWLLTQEIRLLIQLCSLTQRAVPFATACSQLKIWSQRSQLYHSILKKIEMNHLYKLLQHSKIIDEHIKSNKNHQIWQSIEQLALSLCLNKSIGYFE